MTKRHIADLVFMAVLGAVVVRIFLTAQAWPSAARAFPSIMSAVMVILLLLLVLRTLVAARQQGRGVSDEPIWKGVEPSLARKRALQTLFSIGGMAVLVWLLGFPIGGPVALAAHLLLVVRERVAVSLLIVSGSVGVLWALSNLLRIRFVEPALPFVSNPF